MSVMRPATLPIVVHVCSMDGYDCQLKATYDVSSIIHFTFFVIYFFLSIFTKALKRYNEYAYSKGAMKSWNSLHDNDTPFPKQSEELVNHSLSVAVRTMQPNAYIVARSCFNGPVERRRGTHSSTTASSSMWRDAPTIARQLAV